VSEPHEYGDNEADDNGADDKEAGVADDAWREERIRRT
jgi:hypothetical protein